MRIYLFFCLFLSSLSVGAQGILPFNNPDLPVEERVEDLVRRLTLHEKVLLMCDYSSSVPRLGIKQYNWWNEALHGVGRAGLATVFPQAIGMAATFDDCAVKQVFECVSDEARAKLDKCDLTDKTNLLPDIQNVIKKVFAETNKTAQSPSSSPAPSTKKERRRVGGSLSEKK